GERAAARSMGLGCPGGGLFWLVLASGAFWGQTAGQILPQGFTYASYEVIIPRKLTPRYGQRESQHVTYLIQIEGKSQTVHLTQKRSFLPKHFPVFTYSKEGELQVDYPFIRDDCFYHGFVQGMPSSSVTISTCSEGLRGLFQLENRSYEIEPVQASASFQHVVYRLEEEIGAVPVSCGLTEEEQSRQVAMMQGTEVLVDKSAPGENWWTHTRYLKLAVVIEHERYVKFGRNETLTVLQVLNIIHTSNSLFKPLSVKLTIIGLEIWSQKNLINVTSIGSTLEKFRIWRRNSLNNRLENDVANLFAYKKFGIAAGLAYVGTVCSKDWSSTVEEFVTSSLLEFSVIFTHELGHIIGMIHDGKFCKCDRKKCIMSPTLASTDKFSNCSYSDYFRKRNARCLFFPPDPNKIYKFKYCGNKVVESGEQCDCGSKAECDLDPCCQSDCTLRSGVTCAFGQCCAKCQYLPARSICRGKAGDCDLPEYCNGTSQWCPDDVYIQDGTPCSNGAYCYHGNCTVHNGQCKMIFGDKATVASDNCFRLMNVQGDRFGNCGLKHGIYTKCNPTDILCGRIQCENIVNLPSFEEHSTIIHYQAGNTECWSLDYHSGMEIADVGAIRDGTPCGNGMMCIGGQCKNVSLLNYDCDVTKCHNRGRCNSQKHCHCDYGWAPPDCLSKGYGGSIDSGPAAEEKLFSLSSFFFWPYVLVVLIVQHTGIFPIISQCKRLLFFSPIL
uniref:Uncharacterized protein n=1 Tax=Varanus komodoensis TaxID=61221 RepID=A0A8D2IRN8_VARKO